MIVNHKIYKISLNLFYLDINNILYLLSFKQIVIIKNIY